MTNFVDTMRLKGMAEEDIYFARRDRDLIAALREKRAAGKRAPDATTVGQATDKQKGSA